ncbi:MAG TPA: class I SAM-dependent methyltransferase [Chitinophagaceae bacterium]|nr:class I SAM-dependent methyltransferase [Chitinophagaceae bacterium]
MKILQTAERVSEQHISDNYVYQRSLLAYFEAAKLISGNVLEIGTGSGYGIKLISPKTTKFLTIDKFESLNITRLQETYKNVEFKKINVPPLSEIPGNAFDYIITFQVIEHIKEDKSFVAEAHRVLKSGGFLIISTPNKKMSLTRNPWHVREYTTSELEKLLLSKFNSVEKYGVFGNEKVMDYYKKNKKSVEKITRFDLLNLQYRLPRWVLQIPYDILNRINRKMLLRSNTSLASGITMDDYYLAKATEECLDLFYIAQK